MASARSASRTGSSGSPDSASAGDADKLALLSLPLRDGSERRRVWSPKVKTGCLTCRARRVKCDEGKPECRKCLSVNRTCQGHGYGRPATTTTSPPATRALVHEPKFAVCPKAAAADDMRLFHFFRTEAAACLAGSFDQRFCAMDLLQAARLHPMVFHACAALAAMYQRESMARSNTAVQEQRRLYVMALKQYDHAIRSIRDLPSETRDTNHEVLLISCVLFTAICCLQGDLTTALVHLQNGQRLFREWGRRDVRYGLVSAKPLAALMSRMCTQSIELRVTPWETDTNELSRRTMSTAPFLSVSDAYLELEPLSNGFLELRHAASWGSPTGDINLSEDVLREYKTALESWSTRFFRLQEARASDVVELEGRLMLEARYWTTYIQMHRDAESELDWDTYQAEFAKIVALAQQAFEVADQDTQAVSLTSRAFSFSSSAMDSVFHVARFCRHYTTRHKALNVLRTWNVKDGVCDTALSATIAQAFMKFEEAPGNVSTGCGCDGWHICEAHRIRLLAGKTVHNGTAAVVVKTVGDLRDGGKGTVIPIVW